MQNLAIFTIPVLLTVNHIYECCRNSQSGKCCFNYYEHMNGHCLECPLGTIGTNCSGTCPSGYFGNLCKNKCNCADIYCNNIKGCLIHTDHTTTSSTETKFVMTESQSKSQEKITASTWNNLTFTFIGCVGTLFIVGVMCYIKSWFMEMKFRTRGIEPSVFYHAGNANITTIQNMENMLNEGQEEGLIATGCRVLAVRNKAKCDDAYTDPQTRNIYKDLNQNNKHKAEQNGVVSNRGSRLKEIVEHKDRDLQSDGAENIYSRIILGDEQPQRDDSDDDDLDDGYENEGPRYEQPWLQLRNSDGNMKSHKIVRQDEEGYEKNIYDSCKCSFSENEYLVESSVSPYSVYEGEFIQGTTDHSDSYTCINKTNDETYTCMNKVTEKNYMCIKKTREENNLKGGSKEREVPKERSA